MQAAGRSHDQRQPEDQPAPFLGHLHQTSQDATSKEAAAAAHAVHTWCRDLHERDIFFFLFSFSNVASATSFELQNVPIPSQHSTPLLSDWPNARREMDRGAADVKES